MHITTREAPRVPPEELAPRSLKIGTEHPYDERPAVDAAHAAAQGIIADLTDRRTIKWSFEGIDLDVKRDIVDALAAVIRRAFQVHGQQQPAPLPRRVVVTRTLAAMEVSPSAYDEIRQKMQAAYWEHAFVEGLIDMTGVGLERAAGPAPEGQG